MIMGGVIAIGYARVEVEGGMTGDMKVGAVTVIGATVVERCGGMEGMMVGAVTMMGEERRGGVIVRIREEGMA